MKKYRLLKAVVYEGTLLAKGTIIENIPYDLIKRDLAEELKESATPPLKEQEEEFEEVTEEITLEDLQKKTIKELDTLAKDNNIKLEGKNQEEKAKELFNKLAENSEE